GRTFRSRGWADVYKGDDPHPGFARRVRGDTPEALSGQCGAPPRPIDLTEASSCPNRKNRVFCLQRQFSVYRKLPLSSEPAATPWPVAPFPCNGRKSPQLPSKSL